MTSPPSPYPSPVNTRAISFLDTSPLMIAPCASITFFPISPHEIHYLLLLTDIQGKQCHPLLARLYCNHQNHRDIQQVMIETLHIHQALPVECQEGRCKYFRKLVHLLILHQVNSYRGELEK